MSWTIIVASSQADQLDELVSGAEQIAAQISSPGATLVMDATSVEEVMRKRQRSPDGRMQLLIVAASLPNSQSSPDPQAQLGLDLIKSIAQEAEPPACILVSDQLEHYRAVQGIKRCEWLAVNCSTNYVEQCLQLARKLGVVSAEPVSLPEDPIQADADTPGNVPRVRSPSTGSSPVPDASAFTRSDPSARLPQQPDGTATYALLEVELPSKAKFATIRLEIHKPEGVDRVEPELLNLKQRAVDELIKDSQELKKRLSKALEDNDEWRRYGKRWQADYRALGERVAKLFWPTHFAFLYGRAYAAANGNVRLRFNLERPLFDGLWEAMFDSLGERFLMLDNTITRRARQRDVLNTFTNEIAGANAVANPIGADERDLNVLVVRSDVPDGSAPEGPEDQLWKQYWASFQGGLPELPHLGDEVKVLRDLQRPRKGAGNDGAANPRVKVDVLPRTPRWGKSWSLAELVQRTLKDKSRHYDIVHFAGHALFAPSLNKDDGRGYLIFSGYPQPCAVPIATVATWFAEAGVQLVYLSCCRSSAAPAALEFARNKVPMTIGFHWDLDDSKAVDFAKNFYRELLDARLKVCPAFSKARRKLYDYYEGGDPIWASPVLVAQPMDWIQVEGVLRPPSHDRRPPPRMRRAAPPRTRMPVLGAIQPPVLLHP
jgi:hypothetical protein